ncbi:hypothetical protein [Escherichia albertii]|uniref:hypothetical protein n=1 Tax=Escherichia albertii TaxID=208962 RepID=UPI00235F3F59|nr:hypothetical protein [Escherichia albertii]WDC19557.1 hypothetical protein PS041_19060 [Escherichia albertii]
MAQEISPLSSLFKNGADRLALLGKYHHALMKGYVDGFIDETVAIAGTKNISGILNAEAVDIFFISVDYTIS